MTVEHLLAIPIHRPRQESFDEVFCELAYLRNQGWNVGFLLLDSCPDPRANQDLISDRREVPTWHLNLSQIESYCEQLDGQLAPLPGVANFGKIANLCGLLAVTLGAQTLTRRDGDEFLVERPGEPGYWLPTERDLELLKEHPQLVAAGTTHFGDCDSDIEAIYAAGGPELMGQLGDLLGLSLDFADPEVRRSLQHPRPEVIEDWTRVGEGAIIYPGTSTVRQLFCHFPVPPIDETPDVDNLYLCLAGVCGWPLAAHGRLLEHRHEAKRRASATGYWVRLASAIDYVHWLHGALPSLQGKSPQQVAAELPHLFPPRDREERTQRLGRYRAFLAQIPDGSAALLKFQDDEVLDRVDRGLESFQALVSQWSQLVDKAGALDLVPVNA